MPRVGFILDDKHKSALENLCQDKGIKVAQMLRMMVEKVTEEVGESNSNQPRETKSENITLRVYPSIMEKITERAKIEGFPSRTTWLNSLVKSVLSDQPVLTQDEVNTLRESNRELAAIGRNLNQITRILNTEFRETDKVTKKLIDALGQRIESHKDTVTTLINKSYHRWGEQ